MKKYKSHTTTILLLILASSNLPSAEPPAWWAEQGAINPTVETDDFAVANIGQLKQLASQAATSMDQAYESIGGAGPTITALIDSWRADPIPAAPARDDFATLNQGQLKAVARLFYDRLQTIGYLGGPTVAAAYPWSSAAADDDAYALVNLGQLKHVFSFSITDPAVDADGDGLPDAWEMQWFTSLSVANSVSNYDGDTVTDMDEYLAGTSPVSVGGVTVYPTGGGPNSAPPPPTVLTYDHDANGRLTKVTGDSAANYPMDQEGNLGVTLP